MPILFYTLVVNKEGDGGDDQVVTTDELELTVEVLDANDNAPEFIVSGGGGGGGGAPLAVEADAPAGTVVAKVEVGVNGQHHHHDHHHE